MDLTNLEQTIQTDRQQAAVGKLMRNVYGWMTAALCVTAITAMIMAKNPTWVYTFFSRSGLFWGTCIGELILVCILSTRISSMKISTAMLMFTLYSILNGITISTIMIKCTKASIASTFFITAGMFAAMALVGTFTKRDLSGMGRFFLMALLGLIIATIVNIFVASNGLDWIITYVGVIIFSGLTAYDANKIRRLMTEIGDESSEVGQKVAILGALSLYLDFINLFLFLIHIFGRRN